MASPSKDQPKKEPGQSPDANQNNPLAAPNGHPQHPTNYPPAIGYPYPNPHGQLGYPPQPYHGYPPNAYNAAHPYPDQPPPAAYYRSQLAHSSSSSGFFRGCLAAVVIFVILSCLSSLVLWFVLRPEIPLFRVDTFSVSNFNASGDFDLTAIWEANVTVGNPNQKLKVYFDQIENFVSYDEDLLSSTFGEPLFLDTKGQDVLHVKLSRNNSPDQQVLAKWVVKNMGQDRNEGSVSFNFRMVVLTTFKYGSWWTRHTTLKVFCDKLKVDFVGATGNGMLHAGQSSGCAVYV